MSLFSPNQANLIDRHIARNLRQFRLMAGMTQDDLGELAGITFQQVQKYEKAQNRISSSRLFEFSQILSKPISEFFKGAKYEFGETLSDKKLKEKQINFDKDVMALIKAFNRIEDPQSKKNLIALANSIAKPVNRNIKHCYS